CDFIGFAEDFPRQLGLLSFQLQCVCVDIFSLFFILTAQRYDFSFNPNAISIKNRVISFDVAGKCVGGRGDLRSPKHNHG
ncbi:MAG: hypothetical protein LBT35_00260, partial [Tannerella sp.]|nr:hypothetical protein [Tannerella sp.]